MDSAVGNCDGRSGAVEAPVLRSGIVARARLTKAGVAGVVLGGGTVHTGGPVRPAAPAAVDRGVQDRAGGDALFPVGDQRFGFGGRHAGVCELVPTTMRME